MPDPYRTPAMMSVSEHKIRISRMTKLLKQVNDKYEALEKTSRVAALKWDLILQGSQSDTSRKQTEVDHLRALYNSLYNSRSFRGRAITVGFCILSFAAGLAL